MPQKCAANRSSRYPFALLALLLLGGCATSPAEPERLGGSPPDETLPLIGLEAYRDGGGFYLGYRQGELIAYTAGDWSAAVRLSDDSPPGTAVSSLAAMEYRRSTPWRLPADAVPLPILQADQWQALREQILRQVVPNAGAGVAVDFEHVEFFLYFDQDGRFQATHIDDRPSAYPVRERMRYDEFMRRAEPTLRQFLRAQDITERELVFSTGDAGPYSLPFLYVDTERRLLIFIRNLPDSPPAVSALPGLKTTQALGHVMRSHLSNLVLRPVSSLYRLFFVVTGTTVATLGFDWTTGLADVPPPPLAELPPMDLAEWERSLDRIARREPTSGSADILVDGEAYFSRLTEALEQARHSVRLQTYIFDNDDFAVEISALLKRRSNEGVDVRVLLDGMGTIGATMSDSASLPEDYVPPDSVHRLLERDSRVRVYQKPNPWFTGDHVKSTIVDDELAFVGGMNIGREYRYDWHDLMVELRGPVVDEIAAEFDTAWAHAGPLGDLGYLIASARHRESGADPSPVPLRLLLTGPGNYEIFNAQREAIRRARSYIYIENAYFTDDQLLRELVLARRRGVDVRVVIPIETDHGPITRSNVLAANLMLKHGIRVFLYPGFSHVKAAIYDGWVCLGSANFDRLSLRLNRELNIASSDPRLARQLVERLFEPDFRVSPELLEPIPERWMDYLVEIFGDYFY